MHKTFNASMASDVYTNGNFNSICLKDKLVISCDADRPILQDMIMKPQVMCISLLASAVLYSWSLFGGYRHTAHIWRDINPYPILITLNLHAGCVNM